jgi:hypothetical protein
MVVMTLRLRKYLVLANYFVDKESSPTVIRPTAELFFKKFRGKPLINCINCSWAWGTLFQCGTCRMRQVDVDKMQAIIEIFGENNNLNTLD